MVVVCFPGRKFRGTRCIIALMPTTITSTLTCPSMIQGVVESGYGGCSLLYVVLFLRDKEG